MRSLTLHASSSVMPHAGRGRVFPCLIGFFFVSRIAYTFLFFQANPALGSIVAIGIGFALLYGSFLYIAGCSSVTKKSLMVHPTMRWIFAYLFFTFASIFWTEAQSVTTAVAYWAGMVVDIAIVLVLMRHKDPQQCVESLMKGAIWGAAVVSVIAWIAPPTADLRLGNDAFLHPNTLGMELGMAILFAQYLLPHGRQWKWLGIALAVTLLRTVSKTAIIAFVLAESWYLLRHARIGGKAGLRIVAATLVVVACFWGALTSYFAIYNGGSGNQIETLTGRTVLWATAIAMGLERPWLGHGFYSFRALIPAFGPFEPWHAHNELIQHFFEYGAVGIVLLIGIHWRFYRDIRKTEPVNLRALAFAVLIFALIHGVTDTVPFGLSYPLWLMCALTLSLERTAQVTA